MKTCEEVMDISKLFKAKQIWDSFGEHHPKFRAFVESFKTRDIQEGTVIDISLINPDGSTIRTNFRVTEEDMELIHLIRKI